MSRALLVEASRGVPASSLLVPGSDEHANATTQVPTRPTETKSTRRKKMNDSNDPIVQRGRDDSKACDVACTRS